MNTITTQLNVYKVEAITLGVIAIVHQVLILVTA